MVEASGTNASSVDDGTISTSRKLFRAMKVFDIVSNGEGRGRDGMPEFGSRGSSND